MRPGGIGRGPSRAKDRLARIVCPGGRGPILGAIDSGIGGEIFGCTSERAVGPGKGLGPRSVHRRSCRAIDYKEFNPKEGIRAWIGGNQEG